MVLLKAKSSASASDKKFTISFLQEHEVFPRLLSTNRPNNEADDS